MAVAEETLQHLRTAGLSDVDPEIAELLGRELERQRGQIELIASENFTWPSVFEAVGSVPTRPRSSGTHSKSMSTSAASSALGCVGSRPFSLYARSTGSGL